MKLCFFLFTLPFLLSLRSFAETKMDIMTFPEVRYIFREINLFTRTPEEIEKAELVAHDAIESLVAESRRLKLGPGGKHFFRMHFTHIKILETCLPISSGDVKKYSRNQIRTRPSGKYLIYEYTGPADKLNPGAEIKTFLSSKKLKIRGTDVFLFKKSVLPKESNHVTFHIPIE